MSQSIPPEIRFAVFGASASGKTTLLASYFGSQQRNFFEEANRYRLEAVDTADGNTLLSKYYNMEKTGEFPLGTEQFMEHTFALKISGLPAPCLQIKWFDYPGGWWDRSPADEEEKYVRQAAFKKLLESHVGILLIDGQRYQHEGLPYVRTLLDQFKGEIRKILDQLASENTPLSQFPTQWILAITKADQLPEDVTAEIIGKDIVSGAIDQINGVAKAVNAEAFGHQYLLLSAVQGDGGKVIDANRHLGLELIAPIGLLASLSQVIANLPKGKIPAVLIYVCETLSRITDFIDKLDNFLPLKYQALTALLKALALKEGLEKGAEYFRGLVEEAVKSGDSLKATANLMKMEMAKEEAKRVYFCNQ